LLESRANQWVPLFEITPLAAQYSARIFELRGAGYEIRNRTEHRSGAVHSWFMLVVPKEQAKLFEAAPQGRRAEVQPSDESGAVEASRPPPAF
jgi:hypothetical protein